MNNTVHIKHNLQTVRAQLEQAATDSQRSPSDIRILAVSKTKPVSDIMLAYESGQREFGENYVQEGVDKIHQLNALSDVLWHFIGPLQSNKSKLVAENFDWVHSVDRLKIAQRLNQQRPRDKLPLNFCIQVNIDDDPNKSGITPDQVLSFAHQTSAMTQLTLRGLMTIPKQAQSETELAQSFHHMNALFEELKQHYPQVDTLSMGMSADLRLAISCGSTMVRVGTAIFGRRE